MYPVTRLLTVLIKSAASESLAPNAICETTFRCRPWDLDLFLEMNNGRILTLYDLGRFDLAIRTGLAQILVRRRWGLVVAGSSIRYRKQVKIFDKVTMHSQVVGLEGRWIYVAQSMWVRGEPTSTVLLRTGVISRGKIISIDELLDAMQVENWVPEVPAWVTAWSASDDMRPWPPVP